MKVAIIGGGNMGGAIASGLAQGANAIVDEITVVNKTHMKDYGYGIKSVVNDYSSVVSADIVIVAVKPWLVDSLLEGLSLKLSNPSQILLSVAAGVPLKALGKNLPASKPVFRIMPNTAISKRQSMTFVSSMNASKEQEQLVLSLFSKLGAVELIDEKLFSAATALSGCGIAYAFRYIRAAVQGGVEMGLPVQNAQSVVLQTLKGAIALLEENNSHPEEEIDKVTTPAGLTIKGLNEMEAAGFTSSVIRGLKASNQKES